MCFVFMQRGKAGYRAERASQTVEPGSVFIYSNSTGGTLCPLEKRGCTARFFLLGFENLASLLHLGEISLLEKVTSKLNGSRYYPPSSRVAAQAHQMLGLAPEQSGLEHRGHLLAIAARVLAEEFKLVQKQAGPNGEQDSLQGEKGDFAKFLERVSLNDVQNLSVEKLARKLGCSRRHLNRLFHEHFHTSASALKMEVRLLKAVSLLQNPASKIIDIAGDCGFNHVGLFSQCFKKRFAASPNEWRKQELARRTQKNMTDLLKVDCEVLCKGMCLWHSLNKPVNGNAKKANGNRLVFPVGE